jgi:tripartite-type tricarboxylate transporter receptor subunit TctC
VPSVVELGLPQLVAENYFGVSAPAGLPADIVERLHKTLTEIVARPEIVKRLEELGVTPIKMSPAEFGAFVGSQVADWAPAIKAADLKP